MKAKNNISIILSAGISLVMLMNTAVYAESTTELGDINSDGMITAVDASSILTEYALSSSGHSSRFSDAQKTAADVNADGTINARDAALVLSFYAYSSMYSDNITLSEFISSQSEISVYPPASLLRPAEVDFSSIPSYTNKPYAVLNNNVPTFEISMFNDKSFEFYSELDALGRCGVCISCIGKDLMPTESRGQIGMIKPTGWHYDKYDDIDGKYLYNRCHLIGYQLTAENANPNNLITGTRYFNVQGMLPFEEQTASYVKKKNGHVIYRVTPIFVGDDLLCRGVVMEGWSVEDSGASVCFNVFCYNVQPGVIIDYKTGESHADESYVKPTTSSATTTTTAKTTVTTTALRTSSTTKIAQPPSQYDYVANKNSKVFHKPDCTSVEKMSEKNKLYYQGSRDGLINEGYKPCSICSP